MNNTILTKRQRQIFNFILATIGNLGFPPSINEIQKEFSFKSPTAVQDHLKAIEKKGYILRHRHRSRGLEVLIHKNEKQKNGNIVEVPIVGKIPAGTPILAQENIEGTIVVDKSMVKNIKDLFALRVKGNSMVNAGIFHGDIILVKKRSIAEKGEIIVGLLDDEACVKRLYERKGIIYLKSENEDMKDISVDENSNFRILGKVIGVIRKIC